MGADSLVANSEGVCASVHRRCCQVQKWARNGEHSILEIRPPVFKYENHIQQGLYCVRICSNETNKK